MTGRRRTRSTFLPRTGRFTRSVRTRTATLVAGASLVAGCGAIPGTTGGAGDDPVVVMTWAPQDTGATNKPGMPAFAQAYARWVNDNGGLGGHDLKVLTCNDHNDTVGAATCARQAVKEGAVAVVGSYSQYSKSFFPPLEGAGVPYIGGYGVTENEFTSPLSYPVNGGQPALLAGLGEELAKTCGRIALVRPDTIAGDPQPVMLDAGLETGGHAASDDQRAAEDAAEYGTAAEAALKEATRGPAANKAKKGCVVPALGDRTSIFMDSFRRVRAEYPEVRTASVLGSVDQTEIDSTGGASSPYEGAYVTGWYPVASDRRWDGMKKVIKEEAFSDTRIDAEDTGVQTTYLAFMVLKQAVESLKGEDVTAGSLRGALDDGLKVDTGGLTPTLGWEFSGRLGSVGFPRMVNSAVTLQVVRQGRLVAARGDFVDVTKSLQAASLR
ncbi:ABC transporter substrate-binding protein [Streptomyces acidiscabies]|uniref:ABC transporter substrate-binding protein n=1 Tax=Streptomyces acidiscabies TaxID=42234 RepID=A0AAP6BD21_9ACTN|nr:ABC transporter substrate-binding protein [Streptomyces acidiscabies]MBP5938887.1 ABC transporter substrate-binding protein [Streptomyces sp. LBUM 1476]MBZ3910006.1 ABC transporter substrate-binding protein [Streptomyces acidiscabies]MDX2962519.1 ABC transporter substrate-binding protein [Streptomyces acidiscabies]MDX3020432.1 ABC transporter substrate-binding protein [Streptomyces acidiscabies]MDX3789900.1 ABC transporter substrate-binding protein [Streptomyces acidiscabies]